MLIRLTGLVTVEHEGAAPQHLSGAQAQVAFARLVLERFAGTGRDALADTVWPDGLPDTWASALRSVVSRVRAFVAAPGQGPGATPLVSQGGRYVLRLPADAAVDVEVAASAVGEAGEAFGAGAYPVAQQLAAGAIANLRGSFLPDHDGEWACGVRDHVDELRICALETASLSASALGEEHHALRWAEEAVRRAPFRESAYRCRMAALAAAGNRAEALRCYQQLRQVLAEELGIDPGPESQDMYLSLLRSPAPAADAPLPAPAAAAVAVAGAVAGAAPGAAPAAGAAVPAVDPVLMGIFEPLPPGRWSRSGPPVRAA
ncbi:BTAD domain-containing putative transcriptional regulator [Kitasatospora sp. NPDC057904]|uniref:AfsR/SARP family transcriptional regulator n=1 Tax=Kitasatospora sp. NPDC057904 TaxID=3346275 RepID=UPI0036DD344B